MGASLEDVLQAASDAAAKGLRVALPGSILRYYEETQTADIRVDVRQRLDPTDDEDEAHEALPTISNVPIKFARTASWILSFPLAAGDRVEIRFADVNLSAWRAGGEEVSDPETHGLAGAYAVPGLYPDGEAWESVSTTHAVLEHVTGGRVAVGPSGVELGRGPGLAPLPTLASVQAAFASIIAYAGAIPGAGPPPVLTITGTTEVTAK